MQISSAISKISVLGAAVFLGACSYTQTPNTVQPGSQVGGTGDVGFTHEPLGNGKHLVTVTAAPGLMETEGSIAQRIHVFATKFAAKTCSDSFDFIHDPNFSQELAAGFMKRTKSYVFSCRKG